MFGCIGMPAPWDGLAVMLQRTLSFELPVACVWQRLLRRASAAPLQENPCEELTWGGLAVEVRWCCQGIEYRLVWLPVHVVEHVAVSMLPSSCLKEESVIRDHRSQNATPYGQDSVVVPNIGLPVGSSLLWAKPKSPLSPLIIFIVLM